MTAKEHFQRGVDAFQAGNMSKAEDHFRSVLKLSPQDAQAHLRLAYAISAPHRTQEALEEAQKARDLDPRLTSAYGLLSSLYQRLGRFEEAIASCHQALAIQPDLIPPYGTIVRCKRVDAGDIELVKKMESLLMQRTRTPIERLILHYALGKSYEDLGQFEPAFRHFEFANQLGGMAFQGRIRYNFQEEEAATARLKSMFSREAMDAVGERRSDSEVPVFIVGMLRSGTTLLDSLLSKHDQIASAGEQYFWKREAPRLYQDLSASPSLAEPYLKILREAAGDSPRTIDKMPLNFRYLGFIHTVFPKAKIVHIRRHPVDTCISLYTTQFATFPPDFGFHKPNIVHAYRQYLEVMEHWRSVLSSEVFFETDYETIVEDKEGAVNEILRFLGVEGESFNVNADGPAEVFTPSVWQVRQPVYRTSMMRWKNYEPWLGDFAQLLP